MFAVLGVLQAFFQPLILDESYYLYYAQQLDAGYFDHPPLVAFLIKVGQFLGTNELGVRLGSCLLSIATFGFLLKLVQPLKGQIWFAFALLFSFPFIHALHIAIPDSGLIFFTVLFYFFFEKFLKKDSWVVAIGLGIMAAGMVYAKYHGLLTIGFAVLSFPKLLQKRGFWIAFGTFFVLLIPHVYWLYQNDFVTVRFQLFGRGGGAFSGKNIMDYLLSFGLIVFGLFFVILFIPKYVKKLLAILRSSVFERSLAITLSGFFLFFLIFSLKGPIEGNWLFSASVPALILIGRSKVSFSGLGKGLVLFSAILFMIVRVVLMTGTLPDIGYLYHFTGYEKWAKDIQKEADGADVYFENSYQLASMYTFQTGEPSFSLNTLDHRSNQYDLSCFAAAGMDKDVLVISEWMSWESPADTMVHEKGTYKLRTYAGLTFLNGVKLDLVSAKINESGTLELQFGIDRKCNMNLVELEKNDRLKVYLEVYQDKGDPQQIELVSAEYELSTEVLSLRLNLSSGAQALKVGFQVDEGPISDNSDKITLP